MRNLKVMLFEDNLSVASLIAEIARKYKFQLSVHHSLGASVSEYLLENPHVVLMDISMGGSKDGVAAMKEIKSANASIGVVAITGHAMQGDREKFIQEGFDDYLAKPFEIDKLIEVLKKWLKN